MKKYYDEINIARGLGALLVVFGHSFPDAGLGIFNNNDIYKFIVDFMYSFHMALFFFLSGFVSIKVIEINGVDKKIKFIKGKFVRLIVPYIFMSLLTMIPKMVLSSYSYNELNLKKVPIELLMGISPNGGLWFLYCLFFIFIFSILLNKVNIYALLICSILISIIFSPQSFGKLVIVRVCFYFCFFILGIVISKNYENIKNYFIWQYGILTFLVLIIINVIDFEYLKNLSAVMGIYIVMTVAILLNKKKDRIYRFFEIIGRYSMDIYVISYFILIPIRIILYTKLSVNYEVVVISGLTIAIFGSVTISKYIIRRIWILKLLILGICEQGKVNKK